MASDPEKMSVNPNISTAAFAPKTVASDAIPYEKISPSPLVSGALAGLVMAAYLLIINIIFSLPPAGVSILKYVLMGGFLTWMQLKMSRRYRRGEFFQHALAGSAVFSLAAAATVAVGSLLFSLINPEWSFAEFVRTDDTGLTAISYASIQLFEVFVIGMIIAFILIQFLKGRLPRQAE